MPVTLSLEIESSDPLCGRLCVPDGHWEQFTGWAALAVLVANASEQVSESELT